MPLPLLAFQHHVGDLYIDPGSLQFISELGVSEFAVVERARWQVDPQDPNSTKIVVVKSFAPHVISTPEDFRELLFQAKKLKALRHPHIREFYGLGCFQSGSLAEVRASMFMVEEYAGDRNIRRLLSEQQRVPHRKMYDMAAALTWAIQLASALARLHACTPRPHVHADVRASNVFIVKSGVPGEPPIIKLGDLKPHRYVYDKLPNVLLQHRAAAKAARHEHRSLAKYSVHAGAESPTAAEAEEYWADKDRDGKVPPRSSSDAQLHKQLPSTFVRPSMPQLKLSPTSDLSSPTTSESYEHYEPIHSSQDFEQKRKQYQQQQRRLRELQRQQQEHEEEEEEQLSRLSRSSQQPQQQLPQQPPPQPPQQQRAHEVELMPAVHPLLRPSPTSITADGGPFAAAAAQGTTSASPTAAAQQDAASAQRAAHDGTASAATPAAGHEAARAAGTAGAAGGKAPRPEPLSLEHWGSQDLARRHSSLLSPIGSSGLSQIGSGEAYDLFADVPDSQREKAASLIRTGVVYTMAPGSAVPIRLRPLGKGMGHRVSTWTSFDTPSSSFMPATHSFVSKARAPSALGGPSFVRSLEAEDVDDMGQHDSGLAAVLQSGPAVLQSEPPILHSGPAVLQSVPPAIDEAMLEDLGVVGSFSAGPSAAPRFLSSQTAAGAVPRWAGPSKPAFAAHSSSSSSIGQASNEGVAGGGSVTPGVSGGNGGVTDDSAVGGRAAAVLGLPPLPHGSASGRQGEVLHFGAADHNHQQQQQQQQQQENGDEHAAVHAVQLPVAAALTIPPAVPAGETPVEAALSEAQAIEGDAAAAEAEAGAGALGDAEASVAAIAVQGSLYEDATARSHDTRPKANGSHHKKGVLKLADREQAVAASGDASVTGASMTNEKRVRFAVERPAGHVHGRSWNMLYMAPELFRGERPSIKSDTYAFGILLYELLVRRLLSSTLNPRMEKGTALLAFAEAAAVGARPELPRFWPEPVCDLLQQCWAQEPADRPTMVEAGEKLQLLRDDPAIVARLNTYTLPLPDARPPPPPDAPACGCRCVIS